MTQCALCEEELSTDPTNKHCDSEEHIFPNSVGGQRTVSGFLCRSCNSTTGETWDAELAEQMQALCLIIGVRRDRGTTPPLKVTTTEGENITLGSGLIDHSQKMTVAARATAEKKAVGQRS
ncbi:HNH endonuclease [Pseudoroseomonas sp. WGS1072]|uniref:HNH endonuclease n=1 Tax=Roseomonas sp. WGS1072 TaxID=3366816 RepID=UPI003BF281CD